MGRLEGDIFSNMYYFSLMDIFIFTACIFGVTNRPRRTLFAGAVALVAVLLVTNVIIYALHVKTLIAATTWICLAARLSVRILYQGKRSSKPFENGNRLVKLVGK